VPVIFAGSDPSPWLGKTGRLDVLVHDGRTELGRVIDVIVTR